MPTLVLLTVRVTESPRGLLGTMISALLQEMAAAKMAAKVNIFLIPSPPLPKDRKLHLVKKRKNSDERLSTGRMMLLQKSPRQKLPEIGKWFVSFSTDYIYYYSAAEHFSLHLPQTECGSLRVFPVQLLFISRAYPLHCLFPKETYPRKTIKINYRIFFLDTVGTNCFR